MRSHAGRMLFLALVPGLLVVLLPPLPQILRNEALFHSPAGPNLHHGNLSHHPADVVNVAIRNIAGQFTSDSAAWNKGLETTIRSLLVTIGLNPDDPSTTFERQKFYLPYFAGLEDIAPSPIQTILFLLLPLALLFRSVRQRPGIIPYFLCAYGAFLFFCLMFRWQPWQGRLLIPGYFIAAPLIGIIMDLLRPSWLPVLITMAELLALRPHLVYKGQRPLLGGSSIFKMSSEEQMSRMMPGRAAEIRQLTSKLVTAPPPAIQIDGGATEIYGLLRALRVNLPKTLLISGFVDHPDTRQPWIIQSTSRDAGVPLQTQESSPKAPLGYIIFWTGSYYLVFSPNR